MKRKQILKKIVALTLCGIMCVGTVAPAHAEMKEYDLLVTKNGKDQNNRAKKTKKDGGKAYEAKYYVTPTSVSCVGSKGKIRVHSMRVKTSDLLISGEIIISRADENKKKSALYSFKVPYGESYRLVGEYYSGTVSSISSHGRYTP